MNLHLKMDILLRKINKNTKEWSEELHSDTTQGKILYLEGDEEYTDSHAAWARYDENKMVQLPECGFGDENLHDLEFLSILTAKNTHLEDMYAAFNKEKKEEEENHALEIPILQPEKGTKGGEDGTLQQLSNSARTLFDTEDPLLGLSQDARDNELKYMASDLAMRNLKEFTIDSNLILANNIHVDFTKAVSIFERALALGTAADLAGGRAHEHEEEALQLLPEYVPDSFNRINIQSSLGIVKGIVERLSSVIPTTVEHAKSEVIVEAETLQKVAIKCQYSLVEHVEISKTHTESEKNPVLDDIWMNACQTTLAEIGTLLAADITKGESLKAASEAAFSNFDKLLSMIKALHTTATEKCTLLDNQFTMAEKMEKERRNLIHEIDQILSSSRSTMSKLKKELVVVDEKNYQLLEIETTNGVENMPAFELNIGILNEIKEVIKWSRGRVLKLNTTTEELEESMKNVNTLVKAWELEMVNLKEKLILVLEIEQALEETSCDENEYLDNEKVRIVHLKTGIERCIEEGEELINKVRLCFQVFNRHEINMKST
jgi:hypothetical protein